MAIRPDRTHLEVHEAHLRAGVGIVDIEDWPTGLVGPLEPPCYAPLDLNWTVAERHHNEAISKSEADQRSVAVPAN